MHTCYSAAQIFWGLGKAFPTEQISENHSGTNFGEVKSIRNDAVSVLINLGIRKSEAFELVSSIISEFPHYNLNEIIKSALNKMAVK